MSLKFDEKLIADFKKGASASGPSSSSPTFVDSRIKYTSRRSILMHSNDMAEPEQPLEVNRLRSVYVVEELTKDFTHE